MPVCNYETDNSWWISKMVKKPGNALPGFAKNGMFKSSVVALDWHPNNELLATGCCDFFCRVFSAYNEGLDEGADSGALGMARQPFGNIVYQAQASGWVETVAWSPSGNVLAFGAHDTHAVAPPHATTQTPLSECTPSFTIAHTMCDAYACYSVRVCCLGRQGTIVHSYWRTRLMATLIASRSKKPNSRTSGWQRTDAATST